jgi:hypothetical protein
MSVCRRRRFTGILVFVLFLWLLLLLRDAQPSGNSIDELETYANLTLYAAADASALDDYFIDTPKVLYALD